MEIVARLKKDVNHRRNNTRIEKRTTEEYIMVRNVKTWI